MQISRYLGKVPTYCKCDVQGIQDLKYSPEENTPEELAISYKEDGNFNFKCKKYRYPENFYLKNLYECDSFTRT